MKTRITFEPSDFYSSGQMIVRESASKECVDTGFLTSVSYKIGWGFHKDPTVKGQAAYMIALSDGYVSSYDSIDALCKMINDDPCGYRPMTLAEMIAVMTYNGNRFQ